MTLIYSALGVINTDHLIEVLLARFLCKVTLFVIIIKKCHCGEVLLDYVKILFPIKLKHPLVLATIDVSWLNK